MMTMCLLLSMATHREVAPRKPPSISVEDVHDVRSAVRQWFSLPFVRYVGSHSGCGCGFPSIAADEPVEYYDGFFDDSGDSREKDLGSVRALVALIDEAPGDVVELFPIWAGDEPRAPQGVVQLRRQDLDAEKFFFTEHFLYRLTKSR